MRSNSEYTITSNLVVELSSTSGVQIDSTDFTDQCTDTTQVIDYRSAFAPFGSLVVLVVFPAPVTDPVLFFGVRLNDRRRTTLILGNDYCLLGGAEQLAGREIFPDGSGGGVDVGALGTYSSGAVAIPGTYTALAFTTTGPLPYFQLGWAD